MFPLFSFLMPAQSIAPQRILVMRYRFIGDTLLTIPFLRQLRAQYPQAQIDLLVAPQSGELLRDCPYIDHLLFFDPRPSRSQKNGSVASGQSFWPTVHRLRQNRYDMAFVLKRSFSSALLAFLAGIPQRIGFDTEGRGFLLTRRVRYEKNRHEIDCFLDGLHAVDSPDSSKSDEPDHRLEGWWSAVDEAKAAHVLAATMPADNSPSSHVVLHLTSSNAAKEWPLSQAKLLADWLLSHPHRHIHCLGAISDAPVYEALRASLTEIDAAERLHNHCGAFNLTESMAFLSRMALVIGVDSGTLHMAAAAGAPVIVLFGPSNDKKWAPPGAMVVRASAVCSSCRIGASLASSHTCMRDLHAEAVIETIRRNVNFKT